MENILTFELSRGWREFRDSHRKRAVHTQLPNTFIFVVNRV